MPTINSGSRAGKQLISLAPWAASLAATVVAVACGGPSGVGQTSQGTGGSSNSSAGGESSTATTATGVTSAAASTSGAGGGDGSTAGIPCDVLDALQTRCVSCHSNPPVFKAPMALVTYADLTAMSTIDAAQTVAERCVVRMQQAGSPMPPGAMVSMTPAQIAAFSTWIQAGYPKGDCVPPDAGPPDDAGMTPGSFMDPPVCSSNLTWLFGDSLGDVMNPGLACNACHVIKGGKAPILSIAGTVYPTGHEPDKCVSSTVGAAVIEITDKNGQVTKLSPNLTGNFDSKAAIALPYTAKLTFNGQSRAMIAAQTSGDCNSCHTQAGINGAPGRIRLP
jgi:hypothetical protein